MSFIYPRSSTILAGLVVGAGASGVQLPSEEVLFPL